MKVEKSFVTPKWLKIKAMYEAGTNGSSEYGTNFEIKGELDELCLEFIDMIGDITHEMGFDATVEGVHLNLWKERIWSLVENAGLLPNIAWKDELEDEIEDTWNQEDDEFEYNIEDHEHEAYGA